jgi:hypothetical protein
MATRTIEAEILDLEKRPPGCAATAAGSARCIPRQSHGIRLVATGSGSPKIQGLRGGILPHHLSQQPHRVL